MAAGNKKFGSPKTMRALEMWRSVTENALKEMPYDLSARQTAVLLHVYLAAPPHSIKSLAKTLPISKAAACRAVDALESAGLLKRISDRRDLRNVLMQRTVKGSSFLHDFAAIITQASKAA